MVGRRLGRRGEMIGRLLARFELMNCALNCVGLDLIRAGFFCLVEIPHDYLLESMLLLMFTQRFSRGMIGLCSGYGSCYDDNSEATFDSTSDCGSPSNSTCFSNPFSAPNQLLSRYVIHQGRTKSRKHPRRCPCRLPNQNWQIRVGLLHYCVL